MRLGKNVTQTVYNSQINFMMGVAAIKTNGNKDTEKLRQLL